MSNQEVNDLLNTFPAEEERGNGPRPEAPPLILGHASPPPLPPLMSNQAFQYELLKRIDDIVKHTSHIDRAVESIRQMAESGEVDESTAETFVHGIVGVVTTREVTNQKALDFIRGMYNDIKTNEKSQPSKASIAENAIALGLDIKDLLDNMIPEHALEFTRELLGMKK